jgi:hypothetical protein
LIDKREKSPTTMIGISIQKKDHFFRRTISFFTAKVRSY